MKLNVKCRRYLSNDEIKYVNIVLYVEYTLFVYDYIFNYYYQYVMYRCVGMGQTKRVSVVRACNAINRNREKMNKNN